MLAVPAGATARPMFETVAARLGIDADLLAYLFNETLNEIVKSTENAGSCTVRGVGKFRTSQISKLMAEARDPVARVIVFERTAYKPKNRPFAAMRLDA